MGSLGFKNKVVGIFKNRSTVDSVLNDLNMKGFDKDRISVLAREMKSNQTASTYSGSSAVLERPGTIVDRDLDRNIVVEKDYTLDQNDYTYRRTSDLGYNSGTTLDNTLDTNSKWDTESVEDPTFNDTHEVKEKDPNAMIKGASVGGAVGVLGGLAALMIPGIGPVLAIGPIAAALTAAAGGAAIGAATGTLIGLLKDEGIPSDRAEFYNRHFNRGDILVVIHTDEGGVSTAKQIFAKYDADVVDTF